MQAYRQHITDRQWNFWTLGIDIAIFTLGTQISSFDTIVPLLMTTLTRENWPVTLIIALRNLGMFLPVILIASFVEKRTQLLPILRRVTLAQRLPFFVLALAMFVFARGNHEILVVIILLMVFTQSLGTGLSGTPWLDIITRTIPSNRIGRFLGNWVSVGALLGVGGAALAAFFLATMPWPYGFAACFITSFGLLVVSFGFQQACHEPARPHVYQPARLEGTVSQRLSHWMRDIISVFRQHPHFRSYVTSLTISSFATLGTGLLTAVAVHQAHLTPAEVGGMSIVLIMAGVCGNVIWGFVADHYPPKIIFCICTVLEMMAMALALIAHNPIEMGGAFWFYGFNIAGVGLARQQYSTRSGSQDRRPIYIGLSSLAIAPGAVLGPLLGGGLADHFGYPLVFSLDLALNALALVSILVLVHDESLSPRGV